jgi:hypothetical protein
VVAIYFNAETLECRFPPEVIAAARATAADDDDCVIDEYDFGEEASDANPQPDADAIRTHVSMLHGLAKAADVEGLLTLTRIDALTQTAHTERFAIGDIDTMAKAVVGWSTHPNLNLYSPFVIFRKDLERGAKGGEADARAILAFVGDLDSDKHDKPSVGLDGLPLHPPYVIETSAGNYQPFYPLAKALTAADAKPPAVALSDAIGGDKGTKDVSHIWRIAGTLNWPGASKLARGRSPIPQPVRVVKPWTGELTDVGDLALAVRDFVRPPAPEAEPYEPVDDARRGAYGQRGLENIERELAAVLPGNRNNEAARLAFKAGRLVGGGCLSAAEAYDRLAAAVLTSWGISPNDKCLGPRGTIWLAILAGTKSPRGPRDPDMSDIDKTVAALLRKADPEIGEVNEDGKQDNGAPKGPPTFELFWHGEQYDDELCPWLVEELIPETGQGLASGQWGTAKTFAVLDLAASIATATPFAGRNIVRQGGTVFVAAEGANQIPLRLKGIEQKLANPGKLPFAWLKNCPNLQDTKDFTTLAATIRLAAQNIRDQFDLPLALIVIDTLSAAGNFKDANDAAEGQRVMNCLAELSRQSGAFVLAVDHFGKATETGTRGSSAKEAAADVVLALLADREINGTVSNMRMALRKIRGGTVGEETPFSLKVVDVDNNGRTRTTCVVEWEQARASAAAPAAARDRWPKSLRIFKAAMENALAGHGKTTTPFGNEGPTVMAVTFDSVRDEFTSAYPADASSDPKTKAAAKRQAFNRALKLAREKDLICSREVAGVDWLWLVIQPEATVKTFVANLMAQRK